MTTLPDWADEWGPSGVTCCKRRTVMVAGYGSTRVQGPICQVSGWSIERCAIIRSQNQANAQARKANP